MVWCKLCPVFSLLKLFFSTIPTTELPSSLTTQGFLFPGWGRCGKVKFLCEHHF